MFYARNRYVTPFQQGANQLVPGFASVTGTPISGNTIHFLGIQPNASLQAIVCDNVVPDDMYLILPMTVIAGADTVLGRITFNGIDGVVVTQVNLGGIIGAIAIGKVTPSISFGFRAGTTNVGVRVILETRGTVPTAAHADIQMYQLRYPHCDWADFAATAVSGTVNTLTIPFPITTSYMLIAVGINDFITAQNCVWSGTAGAGEDNQPGVTGTAYREYARANGGTLGTNLTIINTWASASVAAMIICAALFRLK